MLIKVWARTFMTAAVLFLGTSAVPAQQDSSGQKSTGDELADAARKAREEKRNAPKPKRVFTDEDVRRALPDAPSKSAAAGKGTKGNAAAGDAAKGGPDAEDAEAKEEANSEKAWRAKFQAQREKISKATQELDVLQRELDKSQTAFYSDPQKALTEQTSREEINTKTAKIADKKKEIDTLRQGLSDLEDALRKAGGDPGWAR